MNALDQDGSFDFTDAPSSEVVLLHADLPTLPPNDLSTYLDTLAEGVASWSPCEASSLKVIFPTGAQSQVATLGWGPHFNDEAGNHYES